MLVAVTGSKGFIGSAVVRELERREHKVTHIDRSVGVDVLGARLEEVLKEADAVIHLAGILGTEELFDDPELAIDINVKGTARVLRTCSRYNLSYVGITMPSVWDNVYQATKRAALDLARSYHRHFAVPVSHVRAFNVYGPGQKVGTPQKIIPTFATKAWAGEPIPIWGSGDQTVDLIYVDDVARMLVDAMGYEDDETFDAGTGVPATVSMVSAYVRTFSGSHSKEEFLSMRKGEHAADVWARGEGWNKLSWRPKFDMKKLQQTVMWYRPQASRDTMSDMVTTDGR